MADLKKFILVVLLYSAGIVFFPLKAQIIFPEDAGVIDITKTPYEADYTGTMDVSDIIQQAVDDHSPGGWVIIYFPKGTYLVSKTINWNPNSWSQGPVFQGYHKDSTTIKLTDNNPDFQLEIVERPVLYTGEGVAQKFDRGIRNLTIHTGTGNPGAVGVKFFSNNEGIMSDVNVVSGDGQGSIGIHMAYGGENGPVLLRDVCVEGFNTGIKVSAFNSVTLSRITLTGQKEYGLHNNSHVCSVEELHSMNGAIAVYNGYGGSTLTLINSVLEGGSVDQPAIVNRGIMFARNISTEGYQMALLNEGGLEISIPGDSIDEFSSLIPLHLFPSTRKSLNLEVKHPPLIPWETDLSQWADIRDYGAIPNDGMDDSKAIQDAVDAGKTTVYIPNDGPYQIKDTVYLRGNLVRITGTNAWFEGYGSFILADGEKPAVMVERIRRRNPNQFVMVENHSSRDLVVESAIFHWIKGKGTGDIYLSNCLGKIHLTNPEVNVWSRHHDTEKPNETDWNIKNEGASLWILGLKTESYGIKSWTRAYGKTEILGAHIYPQCTEKLTPMIQIHDASFSGACIRETNFCNKDWPSHYTHYVIEKQGMVYDTLHHDEAPVRGSGSGRAYSLFTSYVSGIEYPETPEELMAEPAGDDRILLTWQSAWSNTSGFIIERKSGDLFFPVDTLEILENHYVDTGLLSSWEYQYRLIAFNDSGYSLYSNHAKATTSPASAGKLKDRSFVIYPNPATGVLYLEVDQEWFNGSIDVSLFDCSGRLINRRNSNLGNTILLNVNSLETGIYFIRLDGGEHSEINRLIIK